MSKKTIEVVVAQHKLTLKTDDGSERVQRAADLVNKRLGDVLPYGQPVSHQVLLLVAMNLADDLIRKEEDVAGLKSEVKKRSQAILTRLERDFPL